MHERGDIVVSVSLKVWTRQERNYAAGSHDAELKTPAPVFPLVKTGLLNTLWMEKL